MATASRPAAPLASTDPPSVDTASRPPLPRRKRRGRGRSVAPYVFLAPNLIAIGIFALWPMVNGVRESFTTSVQGQASSFAGLSNYNHLVSSAAFWAAVRNTFEFVVGYVAATLIVTTALAVMLDTQTWAKGGWFALPGTSRCLYRRSSSGSCGTGCYKPTLVSSTASSRRSGSASTTSKEETSVPAMYLFRQRHIVRGIATTGPKIADRRWRKPEVDVSGGVKAPLGDAPTKSVTGSGAR